MRILQFLAEIVGKAIAYSDSVGDIVICLVVRGCQMDDGMELLHQYAMGSGWVADNLEDGEPEV